MENKELVMPTHIIAGGQVEVGENVIDAVKREIMEEAGVDIEVGEVFCISSNTGKNPGYKVALFVSPLSK